MNEFDIKKGDIVRDKNGDVGKVTNAKDTHNIYVDFPNGGSGLYCINKDCEEYSPLEKETK